MPINIALIIGLNSETLVMYMIPYYSLSLKKI